MPRLSASYAPDRRGRRLLNKLKAGAFSAEVCRFEEKKRDTERPEFPSGSITPRNAAETGLAPGDAPPRHADPPLIRRAKFGIDNPNVMPGVFPAIFHCRG